MKWGRRGMDDDTGPVELPRTGRDWFLLYMTFIVSVHCYIVIVYLLGLSISMSTPYALVLVVLVCGLVPLVAYFARMFVIEAFEQRLVVDVDGLRSMRGARVLSILRFHGGMRVEVTLDASGSVDHYFLDRGWSRAFHILYEEYETEGFARLLPVVMAAVGKHGMKAGENLARLMARTSS